MSGASNGASALAEVRIDKWLWSVRLYKTRGVATEACGAGHVEVGGDKAKASKVVRVGDEVRLTGHDRVVLCRVERLVDKRVGAPVATECYTVVEAKASEARPWFEEVGVRDRGAGRPTKRDRRLTDQLRKHLG